MRAAHHRIAAGIVAFAGKSRQIVVPRAFNAGVSRARSRSHPPLSLICLPPYAQPDVGSATAAAVSKLVSKSEVVQLFRYPGLSDSAAQTLLRKVRIQRVSCRPCMTSSHARSQAKAKVTDAITSIDGEQCYNIGVSSQLTVKEAETLTW